MNAFILLIVLFLGLSQAVKLNYSSDHDKNPLSGWMVYQTSNPPSKVRLLYSYFDFAKVNPAPNKYDFSGIEGLLKTAEKASAQAVFRVVMDYPDNSNYRPPRYCNVKLTPYGKGMLPDYENTCLQRATIDLIEALGNRYDNDPRVLAIKMGLIGNWGEWHNYEAGGDKTFPSQEFQDQIMKAFDANFKNTHVHLSVDATERSNKNRIRNYRIGLHDDSFAGTTLNQGYPNAVKVGMDKAWQRVMFGGELVCSEEGNQKTFFKTASGLTKFENTFDKMPVTYLLNEAYLKYSSTARGRADEAAAMMGYEFYAEEVNATSNGLVVRVKNTGGTPFYYDCHLVADVNGVQAKSSANALSTLQPGASTNVSINMRLPSGTFTAQVVIRSSRIYANQDIYWANRETEGAALKVRVTNSGGTPPPSPPPSPPPPGSCKNISAPSVVKVGVPFTVTLCTSDSVTGDWGEVCMHSRSSYTEDCEDYHDGDQSNVSFEFTCKKRGTKYLNYYSEPNDWSKKFHLKIKCVR